MTILLAVVSIFNSFVLISIHNRLMEILASYVLMHEEELERRSADE